MHGYTAINPFLYSIECFISFDDEPPVFNRVICAKGDTAHGGTQDPAETTMEYSACP